jgi:hypothetical protein
MPSRDEVLRNLAEGTIVDITPLKGSTVTRTTPKQGTKGVLRDSLKAAMKQLKRYANLLNVNQDGTNINESVLRFFVLAEIMKRDRGASCQTEWKKFDLLATTRGKTFLVEFKFYGYNREYRLDGKPGRWKGHPSLKNEEEFGKCLNKLREFRGSGINEKYLVLAYQKGPWRGDRGDHKHSYETSYADLTRFGVASVEEIGHCYERCIACKLITVE